MIDVYKIENFKSLADVDLKLTAANVLLGLNSSGKSSIIQPLLLLRQSALLGTLRSSRVALNGPLANLGTGLDIFSEFAIDEATRITIDESVVEIPYVRDANLLNASLTNVVDRVTPPLRDLIYLSTARIPPQVLYQRHYEYDRASPIVGAQGEDAPGYLAAYGNAALVGSRTQRDKEAAGTLLEQVNIWMRRISPEASVKLDEMTQLDALSLRFDFDGTGGVRTRPYRAGNVGFGLSHSLSIVVALVAADPGTLIILEGPEAHLHPRAQRQLGRLVAQAAGDGVQVIVETHSQELVRGMSSAVSSGMISRPQFTVHYCQRRETKTVVSRIQADHDGRLTHIGGYSEVPEEYYREFSL